jgi:hypothetical protein
MTYMKNFCSRLNYLYLLFRAFQDCADFQGLCGPYIFSGFENFILFRNMYSQIKCKSQVVTMRGPQDCQGPIFPGFLDNEDAIFSGFYEQVPTVGILHCKTFKRRRLESCFQAHTTEAFPLGVMMPEAISIVFLLAAY